MLGRRAPSGGGFCMVAPGNGPRHGLRLRPWLAALPLGGSLGLPPASARPGKRLTRPRRRAGTRTGPCRSSRARSGGRRSCAALSMWVSQRRNEPARAPLRSRGGSHRRSCARRVGVVRLAPISRPRNGLSVTAEHTGAELSLTPTRMIICFESWYLLEVVRGAGVDRRKTISCRTVTESHRELVHQRSLGHEVAVLPRERIV